MRIDWLVPARYAELGGDGTMSILGGGIDTLFVPAVELPATLGIFLAMRLVAPAHEWHCEAHSLRVAVEDPHGEHQPQFEERLSIAEAAAVAESRTLGMLFPTPCRWRAASPGVYSFNIQLDDRVAKTVAVTVPSLNAK